MIIKSYIVEKDLNKISNYNLILFYGANLGLKKDFKRVIKDSNKKNLITNFYQDEIIKNQKSIIDEMNNVSLFEEKKILFIENATEKIFSIVSQITENIRDNKLIIFAEALDKKSKLRNFFEKAENAAAIACYEDNEISIKNILMERLKSFRGLTPENINLIIENSNLDRVKLNNELNKIILYFDKKIIENEKLHELLDIKINEDFNQLKDAALSGDRAKTNRLLSDTIIEAEKNVLYINIINQRLNKLYEVLENSKLSNLSDAISKMKPPIFWKDKPMFLNQSKKWNAAKIRNIINKSYNLETEIKSNASINKNILIKKLLIDICETANS